MINQSRCCTNGRNSNDIHTPTNGKKRNDIHTPTNGANRVWSNGVATSNPISCRKIYLPSCNANLAMVGEFGQKLVGKFGQKLLGEFGQTLLGEFGQKFLGEFGQKLLGVFGQKLLGEFGERLAREASSLVKHGVRVCSILRSNSGYIK